MQIRFVIFEKNVKKAHFNFEKWRHRAEGLKAVNGLKDSFRLSETMGFRKPEKTDFFPVYSLTIVIRVA